MKKILLLLTLITLGVGVNAQNNECSHQKNKEDMEIARDNQHITIDHNTYAWRPFSNAMGYSIYGSRYRKARTSRGWGQALSLFVAPAGAAFIGYSISQHVNGGAIIGGVVVAGALGAGIPLWVKGQREIDNMMDDYAKRFGPKPYSSSITAGPTMNGVGLAFNF